MAIANPDSMGEREIGLVQRRFRCSSEMDSGMPHGLWLLSCISGGRSNVYVNQNCVPQNALLDTFGWWTGSDFDDQYQNLGNEGIGVTLEILRDAKV